MRFLIACTVGLVFVQAGVANDTRVVGSSGRVRRLEGERTSVRMVRESVRMDIYPSHYDVDATFLFRNEGPATTVTMGFPESGGGDITVENYEHKSAFLRFTTRVDGKPVKAYRREPITNDGYHAYWVKQVGFGRRQQRSVRVQYRSRAGGNTSGQSFVTYRFTGGNWRGTVDESTLRVVPHLPGVNLVGFDGRAKRQGNEFVLVHTHWQAEDTAMFIYVSTLPGWLFIDGVQESYGPSPTWDVVVRPGRVRGVHWAPSARVRNGVVFIRLDSLRDCLDASSGSSGRRTSAISWDAAGGQMVLQAAGRRLIFRAARDVMRVEGKADILLPAPPFIGLPDSRHPKGAFYVPLKPVLDLLGGSFRVSPSGHRLHIDLPSAKKPAQERPTGR